jgi:glycogen(starch) synthase
MNLVPSLKRLLMTADAVGGVWHYAIELSRHLGSYGVEVILATMGPRPSSEQRLQAARLGNVRLYESDFRLEWMKDPWADVEAAGAWLLRLDREFAPDLIHLNGYVHAVLPWSAPVALVAHSCVLSWWRAVHGCEAPGEWGDYRAAVRAGLRAADAVIAPTQAMARELSIHYGFAAEVEVIPNGSDPGLYSPGSKEPFVFSAGRVWDQAKNIRLLASVAPTMSWPVCVAGDATPPNGRVAEVPTVWWLGSLTRAEVARVLSRASIYATPARYEPFGLAILEAAFSGCALVLGDIPSLRETWDDAALFVAPDDVAALEATLQGLAADPGRREALATVARGRAQRFTTARMVAAYRAVYRRMLATRTEANAGNDSLIVA